MSEFTLSILVVHFLKDILKADKDFYPYFRPCFSSKRKQTYKCLLNAKCHLEKHKPSRPFSNVKMFRIFT